MTTDSSLETAAKAGADFREKFQRLRAEVGEVIVGQEAIIDGVLVSMFAAGHVLLEGVPGLGKTMLVRTLGQAVDLDFSRIQFTPDLMPADIIGTTMIAETPEGRKEFVFEKGPVFAHLVLADEINRATPKTQSALLEAMQEKHVTVAGEGHTLEEPFLVLATQNPLEMEGTYPLPEAQLDRFFFKLKVEYPTEDELRTILERTTEEHEAEAHNVIGRDEVLQMRHLVRQVPMTREIQTFAIRVLLGTHPDSPYSGEKAKRYVRYGPSPRGLQAMILAAKIYALLDGRYHVAESDIERAGAPALRHRVILNFEGEAEGIDADAIVEEALERAGQ